MSSAMAEHSVRRAQRATKQHVASVLTPDSDGSLEVSHERSGVADARREHDGLRARPSLAQPEPTLRSLREYVSANLDQDLSLAALARRAGMSSSCFSRWFREQTGITPHAFIVEARVAHAKELLRTSELSLLEVALAVGFSSQSCLNVTFRRRAGITPAEYRADVSTKTKDKAIPSVRRSRVKSRVRSAAS